MISKVLKNQSQEKRNSIFGRIFLGDGKIHGKQKTLLMISLDPELSEEILNYDFV